MTATLFIVFLIGMALLLIFSTARYRNGRAASRLTMGLLIWFSYVGVLAIGGVARNAMMRPPGITLIVGPVVMFLIVFIARTAGAQLALAFPLWVLLGTQSFRVGVELFLHRLWIDGLIPRMLTFSGANVDICIGISAPLIAWLAVRGRTGLRLALAWNVLGLLALANVVIRAILTAPGPLNLIHTEVPNQMLGMFPFLFIPAFFVPLAVVLHVLAMRAISSRLRTGCSGTTRSGSVEPAPQLC